MLSFYLQLGVSLASSGFASSPASSNSSSSSHMNVLSATNNSKTSWTPYAHPEKFGGTTGMTKHV